MQKILLSYRLRILKNPLDANIEVRFMVYGTEGEVFLRIAALNAACWLVAEETGSNEILCEFDRFFMSLFDTDSDEYMAVRHDY